MISNIFQYIQAYAQPVYAVGGCLRQKFLGFSVDDYDLIVSHGAIELCKELAYHFNLNWIVLDRKRDIARLFCDGLTVDIAAFGDDLQTDLCLRDISINAIACPADLRLLQPGFVWEEQDLIDPCQGLSDLRQKCIKGISLNNFLADPLRVLRVFRFSASLGFEIEEQTLNWVKSSAHLLEPVASERILNEMFKLLQAKKTDLTLDKMLDTEIPEQLFAYIPCTDSHSLILKEMRILENSLEDQLFARLEYYLQSYAADRRPYQFLLKLALLSWQGFEHVSFEEYNQKLALSRHELDILQLWWCESMRLKEILLKPEDARSWFYLFRQCEKHVLGLCVLGYVWLQSGHWQGSPDLIFQILDYWLDMNNQIAHPAEWVNGNDVIRYAEIKPGPRIGEILLSIQEAQACGEIRTREHALAYLRLLKHE